MCVSIVVLWTKIVITALEFISSIISYLFFCILFEAGTGCSFLPPLIVPSTLNLQFR